MVNERSVEEGMNVEAVSGSRIHQWGGAAFVLGNLLFMANKLDEMSRLFLGRWMPDVISGQNPVLILLGQALLIIGYVAYYRFYSQRVGDGARTRSACSVAAASCSAFGHAGFMSVLLSLLPWAESLFLLVLIGMLGLLSGLIWFGVLNLRRPVLSRWAWLPLATGLMGFIGFILLRGEQITAIFLFFRTLFALGLIGLGVVLWLEKPVQAEVHHA